MRFQKTWSLPSTGLRKPPVNDRGDYAIPGNIFANRLLPRVQQAGIERIWSASPGLVRGDSSQPFLPRMGVEGTMSGEQLVASLAPMGRIWRAVISAAKRLPVRLLGARRWLPIRRAIFRVLKGTPLSLRFWKRSVILTLILGLAFLLSRV